MSSFDDILAEVKASTPEPEVDMSWLKKYGNGEEPEHDDDLDDVRETGESEKDPAKDHGGSGGGSGRPAEGPADPDPEITPDQGEAEPETDGQDSPDHEVDASDDEDEIPVSLQHTDHQDDVQERAFASGGSSSEGTDVLPVTAFTVEAESRPFVRSLPSAIVKPLLDAVRQGAIRELGVSAKEADSFLERISASSLVTAFLLAGLDIEMNVDPRTARVTELLRSRDPQIGGVFKRLVAMEEHERERDRALRRMREEIDETRRAAEVTEMVSVYNVTDHELNLMTGGHDPMKAPFTDRRVLAVRDKAREDVRRQKKIEKDREGRPIR